MEKGHFMNNSNGVSLLEVLLSIAILSILTILHPLIFQSSL